MPLTRTKGGGLNIGDYTQSSRTSLPDGRVLIPADGRLISGGTYPLLEAAIESRDKLFDFNTSDTQSAHRSFCAQADVSKGWIGHVTNGEIREIDFVTGVTTLVHTYGGVGGYSSITCSDDGQNIYACFIQTTTDGCIVVYSNDGGSSWNNITVLSVSTASTLGVSTSQAYGVIECDSAGTNIKVAFTGSSTETTTRVFESNNSATSFSEILTPAKTLTSPNLINEVFISRDLSTVGVLNLGSVANERWLSVGGSAFVDTYNTLPPLSRLDTDAGRRTVVSADGANFFMYFTSITQNSKLRAHTSTDSMASWSPLFVDIYGRPAATYSAIIAALFHPSDNTTVFVAAMSGTVAADTPPEIIILEVDIVSGSTNHVGVIQPSTSATASSTLQMQIQSSIRMNNGDVTLCLSDGQQIDMALVVKLKNGKYIADAGNEPLPHKIVADAP